MVKRKTASQSQPAILEKIAVPQERVPAGAAPSDDDLVQAFHAATPETITAIDADLLQIHVEILKLQGMESALRLLQKSLNFRFGGRPPHMKARGAENRQTRLAQIAAYLWENEPAKSSQISRATGIPLGSLTALLKHPWFEKTDAGFEISSEGCDDPLCAAQAEKKAEE